MQTLLQQQPYDYQPLTTLRRFDAFSIEGTGLQVAPLLQCDFDRQRWLQQFSSRRPGRRPVQQNKVARGGLALRCSACSLTAKRQLFLQRSKAPQSCSRLLGLLITHGLADLVSR